MKVEQPELVGRTSGAPAVVAIPRQLGSRERRASVVDSPLGRTGLRRTGWFGVCLAVLAVVVFASLAVGSLPIPLSDVLALLVNPDGSELSGIIWELRLPRTLLGLAAGAALGVAGALIQALTRNPLADPGILGVNGGAAFAMLLFLMRGLLRKATDLQTEIAEVV